MIEIPLLDKPEQQFNINIDGTTYNVNVKLNTRMNVWFLNLYVSNQPIVLGVALLSGIDILEQYNLAIKNMFILNMNDQELDPEIENLGTNSRLFIVTDEELQQ